MVATTSFQKGELCNTLAKVEMSYFQVASDCVIDLFLLSITLLSGSKCRKLAVDLKFSFGILTFFTYHVFSVLPSISGNRLLLRIILPSMSQLLVVFTLILVFQDFLANERASFANVQIFASTSRSPSVYYSGKTRTSVLRKSPLRIHIDRPCSDFSHPRSAPIPATGCPSKPIEPGTGGLTLNAAANQIDEINPRRSPVLPCPLNPYRIATTGDESFNGFDNGVGQVRCVSPDRASSIYETPNDLSAETPHRLPGEGSGSTVEYVLRKSSNRGHNLLLFDLDGGTITPISPLQSISAEQYRNSSFEPNFGRRLTGARPYKPSLLSSTRDRFPSGSILENSRSRSFDSEANSDSKLSIATIEEVQMDELFSAVNTNDDTSQQKKPLKADHHPELSSVTQWRMVDFGGKSFWKGPSPLNSPTSKIHRRMVENRM